MNSGRVRGVHTLILVGLLLSLSASGFDYHLYCLRLTGLAPLP